MAAPIAGVGLTPAAAPIAPETSTGSSAGPDFASALEDAFAGAADAEGVADDLAARFAAGDPDVGIHEAVIAAEKAAVKIRYAVTLKNKLLDAYRELMNTQV